MPVILQNILRFVSLVLLQVLVLNNIHFLGYICPYLYVLFILSLPLGTPRWLELILAFVLGISIDIFSNTMGLHAFATVLMAFLRQPAIKLFVSLHEEGSNYSPSLRTFGIADYLKYMLPLVLIHHATLFGMEAFNWIDFSNLLLRMLLSWLVSVLLLLAIQVLKKE